LVSRARGHGALPPEIITAIQSSPVATDLAAVSLQLASATSVDWSALIQVLIALAQIIGPLLVPPHA
jgi:hypothetical protein